EQFLCEPFVLPSGGLPPASDACSGEPDLQVRCGCKYCHSLLEPAASHWGRWTQPGAGYLNPVAYPPTRPDCDACAQTNDGCSADCQRNYITDPLTEKERAYMGQLRSLLFLRDEHRANVDTGPLALVMNGITD